MRMQTQLVVKVLAIKHAGPVYGAAWTDEQIQSKIDHLTSQFPELNPDDFEVLEFTLPNIYSTIIAMLMKHGITTGSPAQVWGNRTALPSSPEELALQAMLSDPVDILAEMFYLVDNQPQRLEHLGIPLWKWNEMIVPDHAEELIKSFEEVDSADESRY